MVYTRKIKIIPLNEELTEIRNETYKELQHYRYLNWKLSNKIISELYVVYREAMKKDVPLKDSLKEECKKLNANNPQSLSYEITKQYKEIPSWIRASVAYNTFKDFKTDLKTGLFKGQRAIRNYNLSKVEIPFVGMYLKWTKHDKDYIFKAYKGEHFFKLIFGKDKSNNKEIVERILDNTYKLCDSYIKFVKNRSGKEELYFYMCVDIPDRERKLDKDIIVGVDIGISNPAYVGLNKGKQRQSIGEPNQIQRFQKQMKERKRTIYSSCKNAKGGHGRKRKLKAMDKLRNYESNFVKNINHNISREVVEFAIKNNAGIIKMEDLTGISERTFLDSWPFYQLQSMIEYKAKKEGIEVYKVNPAYTSKMCNKCGHIHTDMDLSVRKFKCENCGYGNDEYIDRDYNASINIAKKEKTIMKETVRNKRYECKSNGYRLERDDKNMFWCLYDSDGKMLGSDRYRHDIAEKFDIELISLK